MPGVDVNHQTQATWGSAAHAARRLAQGTLFGRAPASELWLQSSPHTFQCGQEPSRCSSDTEWPSPPYSQDFAQHFVYMGAFVYLSGMPRLVTIPYPASPRALYPIRLVLRFFAPAACRQAQWQVKGRRRSSEGSAPSRAHMVQVRSIDVRHPESIRRRGFKKLNSASFSLVAVARKQAGPGTGPTATSGRGGRKGDRGPGPVPGSGLESDSKKKSVPTAPLAHCPCRLARPAQPPGPLEPPGPSSFVIALLVCPAKGEKLKWKKQKRKKQKRKKQ